MDAYKTYGTGIIAGNFDVIHPGYIDIFNQMRFHCMHTVVLLHEDPSIERPNKLKPILSVKERIDILSSLKQIDRIETYKTEKGLYDWIKFINPDVRFLGDDYRGRTDYTGYGLPNQIHFLKRDHGWSTTKFKKLIANTL
tara:strand:+ start:1205 stop:1624 length:420 start_codon:yes stop_codon:yes gene_type:complete